MQADREWAGQLGGTVWRSGQAEGEARATGE